MSSSASRWRLRAAAAGVAGTLGWAFVAGGTAYAAAPPPTKPAKTQPDKPPKDAKQDPKNNSSDSSATGSADTSATPDSKAKPDPKPKPPKNDPGSNGNGKAVAQGWLKQAQQDQGDIHKMSDQAHGMIGKAQAAYQHVLNQQKKAQQLLDQVEKHASQIQGATNPAAISDAMQPVVDDLQGFNTLVFTAGGDVKTVTDASGTLAYNVTLAQADVQSAQTLVNSTDKNAAAPDASLNTSTDSTSLSSGSSVLLTSATNATSDATLQQQLSDSQLKSTQFDAQSALKTLDSYKKDPTLTGTPAPAPAPAPAPNPAPNPGPVSNPGTSGGGTQTGTGGSTGTGGQPSTGGDNNGGVPRQPVVTPTRQVPTVVVVGPSSGSVHRMPATTPSSVVFLGHIPSSVTNGDRSLSSVLGETFHKAGQPSKFAVGSGRQKVKGGGSIFSNPIGTAGLGAIPLLAILLLVELLILGRRFVLRAQKRKGALMAAAAAAAKVPAQRFHWRVARVRTVGAAGIRPRPAWSPGRPAIGGAGSSAPIRL